MELKIKVVKSMVEEKKCVDGCGHQEFFLSTLNDHQLCLTKCPKTHPYHNNWLGAFCKNYPLSAKP